MELISVALLGFAFLFMMSMAFTEDMRVHRMSMWGFGACAALAAIVEIFT